MKSKISMQGTWYFDYDCENRLVKATRLGFGPDAKRSVIYTYDALGRRVSRQERKTSRTEFIYDGMDVIQDRKSDGSGTSVVNYVNGLGIDDKLKQTTGTTTNYFLTDHLGSTVGLADQSGSIASQASYDSFGNATGPMPTRYGYTGRELDEYTGLYYYRARFYDPQIGRFISEDPIGFRGGINWYAYVNNNPIRFNDPFGLLTTEQQCMLRWAGVGAVVGTVLGGVGGAAVGALGFAGGPLGLVTTPAVSVKGAILGAVGGAAVGGFVGGFVCGGGSTPVPCDNSPRAVPMPMPTPNSIPLNPPMPPIQMGKRRGWTCIARCNIENFSNVPNAGGRIEVTGSGPTEAAACNAAKDLATSMSIRGTYCRHPHCIRCWQN